MTPHIQSTNYTTAATSLLNIISFLNPEIKPSKEREFHVWKSTVNLPTRASSIFALANYAKKQGLDPKVIIEKKEYDFPDYRFYRYTKEDIDQAKYSSSLHLKEAQENQVKIEEKEITFQDIKEHLNNNLLLMLRVNTKPLRQEKKNSSNFIAVFGYTNNQFHVVDPKIGGISVPEETLKECFETLETKKHRNNKMILFTQP